MVSPRNKSHSKSKPARRALKAKPAKKAAPARAKPAAKKVIVTASKLKKPVPPPKKPVIGKVVPKTGKPAPAMKLKPGAGGSKRPALTPRRGASPETVRPIGMLPPESLARSSHRPPPRPARPVAATAPARPQAEPSRAEGVARVTEKDFKEFEDRLLFERRRILKEMGHLETTVLKVNQRDSSGDLSGYSFHMADAGTDAMEREKAFLFASAEGRVLLEIDDALRRLYRGDYGSCETCSNPIARARLEVMPQARLCISCKEKEEREQRGAM
jgi:RNA polymerase-binding transcription factor